ncbi:hypothetical protein FRC09_011494 [Ceratobasidium sp. 395]|nr:hypothetical protein FRC09_011494 [Ceratobasidium sp. 395]
MSQQALDLSLESTCGLPSASPINASVQSALHNWKSVRTLLADTIQSYLVACSTLKTACTQPTRTPLERVIIEEALVTVDSELSSLTEEAHALRSAQVGLSTLRNKSGRLTRINILPPEILTYVFRLSTIHCVRDKEAKGCYNALAGVDIYWRELALNTPELWTHIDISPDTATRSLYDAARLRLERSNGEPIHFHVYEPKQKFGHTPEVEIFRLRDFISPFASRISTLDVETVNPSQFFIQSAIRACIEGGFSALKDLRVSVPDSSHSVYLHVREPVGKKARNHAISLRTLHLRNALFDLNGTSAIYRGLADFRLQGSGSAHIHIHLPQLANLFTQSPGLVTVKLSGIAVSDWRSSSDPPVLPVVLQSLEVLNLADLSSESLGLVLSLITQPNPAARLSVGLTFYEGQSDIVYEEFFARCHIATIYHQSDAECLLLRHIPPSIAQLVVFQSDISQHGALARTESFSGPTAPFAYHVLSVTLLSCVVSVEGLVNLIADLDIQDLTLDRCLVDRLMDLEGLIQHVSQDMVASLLEVYPNLICHISDEDSTSHLPCRTMFDR